jgi:hypothetical protein
MRTTGYTPDLKPPKHLFALIGILALAVVGPTVWVDHQLATQGRRAAVTEIGVTKHSKAILSLVGQDDFLCSYTATVGFETDTGHVVARGISMPSADVERLKQKSALFIDYLPDKPNMVRFSDDTGTAWLGLLVPLWFFGMHFAVRRKLDRQAALKARNATLTGA